MGARFPYSDNSEKNILYSSCLAVKLKIMIGKFFFQSFGMYPKDRIRPIRIAIAIQFVLL